MEKKRPDPISETVAAFLASRASPSRSSSVVFDNLSVEGWGRGVQPGRTVLTTLRSWIDLLNPSFYKTQRPWRVLLHSFSGTMAGGEMLLVIGKPGSGCTTLLKTLASMRDEYKATTGTLKYSGNEDSTSSARRTFCAEEDNHLSTLTVAETLRFAVQGTWHHKAPRGVIDTAVNVLAKSIGLDHVLDTKIGSEAIRGISGGERRRVSLAEAIATCPDVLCLDNPTNGLDSSTALEFTEMAREFTTQHGCATIMSVYQGSNSMVPLFDKALVIHSGREIFYGKASEAKAYFEELGFECPDRVTITDFLNSMTAEPQLRHVRPGYEFRVPSTALQFEQAFRSSQYYQAVRQAITAESSRKQPPQPKTPAYSLSIHRQVMECAIRQMRVLVRDYKTWSMEATCTIVQSLMLGTIFRDQERATKSFFMLASSLFYAVLVPALQSMNEFGNTFAQRGLVMKQKGYRFYRPLSYALALVVTDIPWKILAIAYNIPQYFLTGFQYSADKFFTWFCIVYVAHLALSMIFRSIAVFSPSMGRAILPVGIFFNILVCYTGLYVPIKQMQVWLSWLRFLNPMYYAYESVMVNEFGNLNYTCSAPDLAPSGPGYTMANQICAVPGAISAQPFVSGRAFVQGHYSFEVSHLWRNVGINAGIFVALTFVTAIGMEMYKVPAGHLSTIFYKGGRKDFSLGSSRSGSDSEKAQSTDDVVPGAGPMLQDITSSHRVGVHNGRTLAWRDLTLDIKTSDGTRRLLDGLNGCVKPGQLTALMGMSGAGKSTLLNALAGRIEFGMLSGDISLDGKPLPKSFRRTTGYVQQQDVHLPTQTVREALQMTARLRRHQSIPIEEKDAYVEEVIRLLDMDDIADALIGVPGAGMNLEQRKRVTIGVELSAMPDILFLDEPTSGLDGQSAVKIVHLLKKLTASGQTILCTIHQPAAEIIETFDNLILLIRGGKLAYEGPFGDRCSRAINYFAKHGRSCGEEQNPAEYFLDVVGAGSRSTSTNDWADTWQSSQEKSDLQRELDGITRPGQDRDAAHSTEGGTYATPFYFQLMVVLKRTWLYYWRDPDYFVSKLAMSLGNALLNGLTYLNSPNSQQGAYNRIFSLFIALIVGPPMGLMVIPRFTALRDLFLVREKASRTYSWLAFVIAAILVELPYAILANLVYWLLWYFTVGYFTSPSRAGYEFLMYELFAAFINSMAQLCAATMPTLGAAFAANGLSWMWCNTWAGTLSPRPTTPSGWRWYFNVSPLYYFAEGATSTVLEGLKIVCDRDETSVFQPPTGQTCEQYAGSFLQNATGYLMNPFAVADCAYCRYKDGESYYSQYGYDFANRYKNIGIFIGFIAFNYTAVIVLTYLTKVKTWKRT